MKKTKKIYLLTALMTVALAIPAQAQQKPLPLADLKAEASAAMKAQNLPGISVAVYRDGSGILAFSVGYADIEKKIPATPKLRYRLASISKPITAVAVMELAAEGKLDLDKPAQQYCAAFKGHPEVTARELLSHRSGVHHYKSPATEINTIRYASLSEAVASFTGDPLEFPAGTRFQYSSYGFTVLGCEIEGASGKSYETFVRERVIAPADMHDTAVDDAQVAAETKVTFYSLHGTKLVHAAPLDTSDRLPGGGWLSTPTDMVKFASVVMSKGLLDEKWKRIMWSEKTLPGDPMHYALGWAVGAIGDHFMAEHAGGQSGTSTSLVVIPDAHLAVAVFTNRDKADMTSVSHHIAAEILGALPKPAN
jgi:CubicO group peptidase (beta-lactamase class C family)